MGRKHGTDTRTDRAFRLLRLLRTSRRPWCLEEIADRLECSKQTARATLADLERSGLVEFDEWREGGRLWIRTNGNFEVPPIRLSAVDLQNLTFCRALVEPFLPEAMREEVDETVPQLEDFVKDPHEKFLARALVGRVTALGAPVRNDRVWIVQLLIEALTTCRVCRVTYRAPTRETSKTYDVAPREILLYRDALYAVCSYVPQEGVPREDYRDMTLALHRIENLELLDRRFPERAPRAKTPRRFGLIAGEPFLVRARFRGWAAVHVAERFWSDYQTVTCEPDGSVLLEMEAQSRPEVISWILSFGTCAELLAPEDLRRQVGEELQKMASQYAPQPG